MNAIAALFKGSSRWIALLRTRDEALPDWLHTLLVYLVTAPFFLSLICAGLTGIVMCHLEPVSGPDLGDWLIEVALTGHAAVMGGWSLVILGIGIFAFATAFTRFGSATNLRRNVLLATAAVLLIFNTTMANRAIKMNHHADGTMLRIDLLDGSSRKAT